MKKLILIFVVLFSTFAYSQGSRLLLLYGDVEGNLRDLANQYFILSGGEVLNVLGGKYTLTQTGAQVQSILNGNYDTLAVSGGVSIGGDLDVAGSLINGTDAKETVDETAGAAYGYKYSLASQTLVDTDSTAYNENNGTMVVNTYSLNYSQPYQPNRFWNLDLLNVFADWQDGTDTVTVAQGVKHYNSRVGTLGASAYFNSDYYMYYSDMGATLASRMLTGKTAYHFYGSGNYPAYFGGTINSGAGFNFGTDTSSTDAYQIVVKGAHTLVAGLEVTFKAITLNTDGATLQVNALTPKALTKAGTTASDALVTGDIVANQIVKAVYDGTQFQIVSRLAQ